MGSGDLAVAAQRLPVGMVLSEESATFWSAPSTRLPLHPAARQEFLEPADVVVAVDDVLFAHERTE